jgi:hypothetical protein
VTTLEALTSERPAREVPAEPAAAYRERLARFWPALV